MRPPDMSGDEYTKENMNYCTNEALKGITDKSFNPIRDGIGAASNVLMSVSGSIEETSKYIAQFIESFIGLLSGYSMSMGGFLGEFGDMFNKLMGIQKKMAAIMKVVTDILQSFTFI